MPKKRDAESGVTKDARRHGEVSCETFFAGILARVSNDEWSPPARGGVTRRRSAAFDTTSLKILDLAGAWTRAERLSPP